MWRDFTFVDDIVQGIELSMEYCSDNAAVFNLGNSKPVKLGYFLEQIEKRLGVKAKFKYQASNAEIKGAPTPTVMKAHGSLGHQPTTSIESGLDQFMALGTRSSRRSDGATGGGRSRRGRATARLFPCASLPSPVLGAASVVIDAVGHHRRADGVRVTQVTCHAATGPLTAFYASPDQTLPIIGQPGALCQLRPDTCFRSSA